MLCAQMFPTYRERKYISNKDNEITKFYSKCSNARFNHVFDTHMQDMFFKVDETDYELTSDESYI